MFLETKSQLVYLVILLQGRSEGTSKCGIRGTNNGLPNRLFKFVHLQLFNVTYKFAHLQLFDDVKKFLRKKIFRR